MSQLLIIYPLGILEGSEQVFETGVEFFAVGRLDELKQPLNSNSPEVVLHVLLRATSGIV